MKRFASHYLLTPRSGFLKQQVVELEEGCVMRFFSLTEEAESVEWMPGVILLEEEEGGSLAAFWLYPFDFTTMQPVAETQRKQLR